MRKKLVYGLVGLSILFGLAFPLIPVGGNYYRGLLVVWHYSRASDSGFLKLFPDHDWYSIVWFADPTSFRNFDAIYAVDRFSVYVRGDRIPKSDGSSFRFLGNGCYVDSLNARCHSSLILKQQNTGEMIESFDTQSFQGNILVRFNQNGTLDEFIRDDHYQIPTTYLKDKTGIYTRFQFGGSVEYIGGGEWNVPVTKRVSDVDVETFEAWSINACEYDEKEKKCVYVNKCFVRDRDFVYEAQPPGCGMTGNKFKR